MIEEYRMMIWFMIPCVIGIFSGMFAIELHKKYYPKSIEWWRLLLVGLLSFFFWPITIPWSIIKIRKIEKNAK
jgi:hypothetical protein